MVKLGPYSFRRILLSRLLLLSVPVLLLGVYVTYRKARSALLDTARQNLTESAVAKGESIHQSLQALRFNLVTASSSKVLQTGFPGEHQAFLEQLAYQLPATVECVKLVNLQTRQISASTCPDSSVIVFGMDSWMPENSQLLVDPQQTFVKQILPSNPLFSTTDNEKSKQDHGQLKLLLGSPVYSPEGKLKYALYVKTTLVQQEEVKPGSLSGYPVIIDEEETILVHPLPERVGRKLEQEDDAPRLRHVIENAIDGRQDFLHLFSLEKNGVELLAGYSSIPNPVSGMEDSQWVILAVTRLEDALNDLKSIRRALLGMTFALIAASFLATLYISRELAHPLEKLRDYALNEEHLHSNQQIPHEFGIREFNQLGRALNNMIQRLKTWAEELETAWKEAQVANQLKNEFLATISHELRTPLNAVIGCVKLVREGYCDSREEEMELLGQAESAANHLFNIINDILDLAKIEEGKLSVTIEQVNIWQLLNEVIGLQSVAIQEKGLEVKTNFNDDTILVEADPLKLKQVILNVVGNAVKFTEFGSISITTRIEEMSASESLSPPNGSNNGKAAKNFSFTHQKVVVTVQDTGIGIDPAQQKKLFRPFVMVDGSRTRKFGGTGLGLAISRNLMKIMGGDITLFSPGEGEGTTVVITVPLATVMALSRS